MSDFTELEYKYKADDVKLDDFVKLMNEQKPLKRMDVSSWDFYYTKGQDEFVRYRKSASAPEITIKRKVKAANNWQRLEVDLPLDANKINDSSVNKFLELLDYQPNFKIYKSCFIFWFDNVNYVYYIVYDENLKERGRFLEVEVNKERVNYLNSVQVYGEHVVRHDPPQFTGGAEKALNKAEEILKQIGITAQNRMKKSLFELFVRN